MAQTIVSGLYTYYDKVAEQHTQLMEQPNPQFAKRTFMHACKALEQAMWGDYELWYWGDVIRKGEDLEIKFLGTNGSLICCGSEFYPDKKGDK